MGMSRASYRKDLRIAVRFPVDVEIAGEAIPCCWARDLSAGGMLFTTKQAVPVGSRLDLSFKLHESFPKVQVVGAVKRLHPLPPQGSDTIYRIAIVFPELSHAAARSLRRLVMEEVMELLDTLREFPAFAKLSEFDLLAFSGVCHRVELPSGRLLARQGDEASSLFIVRNGLVKLDGSQPHSEGSESVEVAGPGQIFGEVSTLMGLPHDLDITALEDTELLGLTREGFFFLREQHPETALRLMDIFIRFTGMRMRRLTRKLFAPLTIR